MDDVLCDFFTQALLTYGRPDLIEKWPEDCWDMCEPLGLKDTDELLRPLNYLWWAKLPSFPWTQKLLTLSDYILSAPSNFAGCHFGKKLWCEENKVSIPLILCSDKHLLAAPGRTLIDDSERNIDRWKSAGGTGILFPQQKNALKRYANDPLQYVLDNLPLT